MGCARVYETVHPEIFTIEKGHLSMPFFSSPKPQITYGRISCPQPRCISASCCLVPSRTFLAQRRIHRFVAPSRFRWSRGQDHPADSPKSAAPSLQSDESDLRPGKYHLSELASKRQRSKHVSVCS